MTQSYLIDGIGDEVTMVFGVLFAIIIVAASWLSTRVGDTNHRANEAETVRVATEQASAPDRENTDDSRPNTAENTPRNDSHERGQLAHDPTPDAAESTSASHEPHQPTLRQRHTASPNVETSSSTPEPQEEEMRSTSEESTASTTTIQIRLKYMDESSATVEANADETLSSFRSRALPTENQAQYRLIYRGQVLRENTRTLRELNLVINQNGDSAAIPVIHCFLSSTNSTRENAANSASEQIQIMAEELHIGSLFLPMLGLCLVCLWYLCIFHTSLFSIQSVVSIVGFSFLYIVLIVNQFL